MNQNDRGTDPVKQSAKRIDGPLRLDRAVFHAGHFGSEILIESEITRFALAGPLRMQGGLRPELILLLRGEFLEHIFQRLRARFAIDLRRERRTPAANLVHDVHGIASPQEELRPAGAAVGRRPPPRAGLAAAMDHNNREGVLSIGGDLVFDIDLPDHMLLGMVFVVMATGVENTGL